MNGQQAVYIIWAIGCIVLAARAIATRRMPWRRIWKPALAWVAIFASLFAVVAMRDKVSPIASWFRSFDPDAGVATGDALRIRKSEDGHFWIRARVNGHETRFLIDSGATTIALSSAEAEVAGVQEDNGGFGVAIETANGPVVAARGHIAKLDVGPIERRGLSVVVAPEFGDTNVLGMNFLSSLSGWRVEGNWLILTP